MIRAMIRAAALALACAALSACSAGGVVSAAAGALVPDLLPDVAANGQAGRVNVQAIGRPSVIDQRLEAPGAGAVEQSTGETGVRAGPVENITVRNDAPPWLLLVALLGWLLPSPGELVRVARRFIDGRRA